MKITQTLDLPGADAKGINLKKLEVDKNDPKTWSKYTKTSCKGCAAMCCSMPIEIRWEDLERLGFVDADDLLMPLKKTIARLKKQKVITAHREETGLFAFKQTSEGRCRYVKDGNLCGVYENRPLVCRAFPLRMGWRHGYCPQTPLKV